MDTKLAWRCRSLPQTSSRRTPPGCHDDVEVRSLPQDPLDQADPVDSPWHLNVGKDRVDVLDHLKDFERFIAGGSLDYPVARVAEIVGRDHAEEHFIVDD